MHTMLDVLNRNRKRDSEEVSEETADNWMRENERNTTLRRSGSNETTAAQTRRSSKNRNDSGSTRLSPNYLRNATGIRSGSSKKQRLTRTTSPEETEMEYGTTKFREVEASSSSLLGNDETRKRTTDNDRYSARTSILVNEESNSTKGEPETSTQGTSSSSESTAKSIFDHISNTSSRSSSNSSRVLTETYEITTPTSDNDPTMTEFHEIPSTGYEESTTATLSDEKRYQSTSLLSITNEYSNTFDGIQQDLTRSLNEDDQPGSYLSSTNQPQPATTMTSKIIQSSTNLFIHETSIDYGTYEKRTFTTKEITSEENLLEETNSPSFSTSMHHEISMRVVRNEPFTIVQNEIASSHETIELIVSPSTVKHDEMQSSSLKPS